MLRDRMLLGRTTATFTPQWHLTADCTRNCAHCYDREQRAALPTAAALDVLHEFVRFCRRRRVRPRVSLSGGDPFLHPGFWDIYEKLARMRVPVAILGNPVGDETLGRLTRIMPPAYYQVSIEGFETTNDAIRGDGSYRAALGFLGTAARLRVAANVMLTLSRLNMAEAIPLGISLAPLTRRFTFNRLVRAGAGAAMAQPSPEAFRGFLGAYLAAARSHTVLGLKENLLCLAAGKGARRFLRGCTGYGCGAAFNFVALLPDGEVHACRKFPSPVGRVPQMDWDAIYDSPAARAYRRGSRGCSGCAMKRICGGCMAFTHGEGLDPFTERDPFCNRGRADTD